MCRGETSALTALAYSCWARGLAAWGVAFVGAFMSGPAAAHPQTSAQVQVGAAGVGDGDRAWARTRLDLGVRVESVWLRESPRDFGVGPYVETRSAAFVHGDYGGGIIALLPVHETFPLWFGAGGFARRQEQRWAPGGNAFVGWGSRSFNYHGGYGMTYGLLLDARVHGGDARGVDLVLAATIDLEALALPFILAVAAVAH